MKAGDRGYGGLQVPARYRLVAPASMGSMSADTDIRGRMLPYSPEKVNGDDEAQVENLLSPGLSVGLTGFEPATP